MSDGLLSLKMSVFYSESLPIYNGLFLNNFTIVFLTYAVDFLYTLGKLWIYQDLGSEWRYLQNDCFNTFPLVTDMCNSAI